MAARRDLDGPDLVGGRGTGAKPDKRYSYVEWKNAPTGAPYHINAEGPWHLTDSKVLGPWGADVPGSKSYKLRHSNIMIETRWDATPWTAGATTKFHLKQTKLLDVMHYIAIPTDGDMINNEAAFHPHEWSEKADDALNREGFVCQMIDASNAAQAQPTLGVNCFGALSIPGM